MSKEQLQLTATKEKDNKYSLLFNRGSKFKTKVDNCTIDELRMIRAVIDKLIK